jgi:hypothetical protein
VHGVGVIIMGNPRAWDTWNELEEARLAAGRRLN